MKNELPRGYFSKILVMDCETSGMKFNALDPSEGYQSVSWGLIVADAEKLTPIDKLYVEIKWDGRSKWEKKAEEVHGLSKDHLAKNGMEEQDAAIAIAEFVYKYWPPEAQISGNRNVRCAGHNVQSFDLWFMRQLLDKYNLMFPTGNRYIDTSSMGWLMLGTFNSDDLFGDLGLGEREAHNALEDSELTLKSIKMMKAMANTLLD